MSCNNPVCVAQKEQWIAECREHMEARYTEAAEHLRTKALYAGGHGALADVREQMLQQIAELWSEHVSGSSDRGYAARSPALDVLCTVFDPKLTIQWILAQMQAGTMHVHWDLALSRITGEGAQWVREATEQRGGFNATDIRQVEARWLQWGREQGYVKGDTAQPVAGSVSPPVEAKDEEQVLEQYLRHVANALGLSLDIRGEREWCIYMRNMDGCQHKSGWRATRIEALRALADQVPDMVASLRECATQVEAMKRSRAR